MRLTPLPQEIDDVLLAFPGQVEHLMPDYEDIPPEFTTRGTPWADFQATWFCHGLSERFAFVPALVDDEPLDGETIWRHLQAIQGSFQPKHEHKAATVAYLASLWMEAVRYGPAGCPESELKTIGDWPEDRASDEEDG